MTSQCSQMASEPEGTNTDSLRDLPDCLKNPPSEFFISVNGAMKYQNFTLTGSQRNEQ